MRCDRFTDLQRRSNELQARYLADDMTFCDAWFFDAMYHIRLLRRRYEQSHRKPYQSQISDEDWDMIEEETKETPIEPLTKLLLEGWQSRLLQELRDLEAQVWH